MISLNTYVRSRVILVCALSAALACSGDAAQQPTKRAPNAPSRPWSIVLEPSEMTVFPGEEPTLRIRASDGRSATLRIEGLVFEHGRTHVTVPTDERYPLTLDLLPEEAGDYEAKFVAVDDDVGGTSAPVEAVLRVHQLGARSGLDPAFGNGGIVQAPFSKLEISANAVMLDASDRILIAGSMRPAGSDLSSDAAGFIGRLNPDGAVDTTFGQGKGYVVVDGIGTVFALQLDRASRLLATGFASNGPLVARFLPDGGVDTSFGDDGAVRIVGSRTSLLRTIGVDNSERLVVIGQEAWLSWRVFEVFRFSADGVPDGSFGSGGRRLAALPQDEIGTAAPQILDPDAISVAVSSTLATRNNPTVRVVTLPSTSSTAPALFLNTAAKAVPLWPLSTGGWMSNEFVAVTNLTFDLETTWIDGEGRLDGSHGVGGRRRASLRFAPQAVARTVGGGFFVAGAPFNVDYPTWALTRFGADAAVDSSFGAGGMKVTVFDTPGSTPQAPRFLVVTSSGKPIVAAEHPTVGYGSNVTLVRYLP